VRVRGAVFHTLGDGMGDALSDLGG
jgi:hypothetical protein